MREWVSRTERGMLARKCSRIPVQHREPLETCGPVTLATSLAWPHSALS